MTDINPASKLNQARKWAEWVVQADSQVEVDPDLRGAAEVINALPNYWIDAEKVWDLLGGWGQRFISSDADLLLSNLRGLLPTMADTEWDDSVHPYMEAVTASGRRHILLAPWGDTAVSENSILVIDHGEGMPVLVPAECLFPTGRYARLSLPDEDTPTQQERVVTEDDYRNAPSGTVVWGRGPSSGVFSSLEKYGNIWLEAGSEGTITPRDMERNGPHEVLRWADVS